MTTSPVRHILVPTDFSAIADRAVEAARACAKAFGAPVHVLHVSSTPAEEVLRLLAPVKDRLSDIAVTVASATGDPADAILRYAAMHPVDLIVMATHGRSGVSRLLIGSVAARVVHDAPCPVLVVPPWAAWGVAEPAAAEPAAVPEPRERRCLVCSTPGRDLVCETCRARIRGEALAQKYETERAGRR
jgi:nucleotide-binding universal stress UspA family protein